MIDLDPYSQQQIIKAAAIDWLRTTKPDLAVTFTLNQAVSVFNGRDVAWIRGDRCLYEEAYVRLIHRVSRRAFKHAFRRHKKLISNFAALEGDGDRKRFHIHSAIRCPEHICHEAMDALIRAEWQGCEWAMSDVQIEPITGRWVEYILKDGTDGLLIDGLRF